MSKRIFGLALIGLLLGIVVVNIIKDIRENNEIKSAQEQFNSQAAEKTFAKEGLKEGEVPPDFELSSLNGEKKRLSDYKGKKVILNFWATWCPPCKAEMPHMQQYYETKANSQNVEIIAVNLTYAERVSNKRSKVEEFKNEYKLTFPILLDEEGDVGNTYQTITIPTTYMIDTNGIIRKKIIGPMDQEMMERLVSEMN
ncbi:peroxiredoxin [Bacillus thermophilus]|uniref:Peroxiredoxin n=1 Tax=Siminovitchia thermophila TaxID=1245522 RepID=A0ABS2RDW2_9BACI|nr:redoxin domain-containing protein [Siminovitchia thermophila]MBM7717590.1 peroxiredoxin [Siminovitchia thermophila]ONK23369.1 thiol-disulfide oxidoreductase [Bacillus sp. VT-16-64]